MKQTKKGKKKLRGNRDCTERQLKKSHPEYPQRLKEEIIIKQEQMFLKRTGREQRASQN